MTDPIRAALEKARAVYCHADGECPCATPDDCSMKLRSEVPAKIIAAFLRALTDGAVLTALSKAPDPYNGWRDTLAEAVLAAAKEQPSSET
jgi:hypothetical protein